MSNQGFSHISGLFALFCIGQINRQQSEGLKLKCKVKVRNVNFYSI